MQLSVCYGSSHSQDHELPGGSFYCRLSVTSVIGMLTANYVCPSHSTMGFWIEWDQIVGSIMPLILQLVAIHYEKLVFMSYAGKVTARSTSHLWMNPKYFYGRRMCRGPRRGLGHSPMNESCDLTPGWKKGSERNENFWLVGYKEQAYRKES
jgi:hypothetical protein